MHVSWTCLLPTDLIGVFTTISRPVSRAEFWYVDWSPTRYENKFLDASPILFTTLTQHLRQL